MHKKERYVEQSNPLQESIDEEIRIKEQIAGGGRIEGVEGGLRADIFDHDENSEYDFSEHDCPICELPDHAINLIIEDIDSA